MPWVFTSRGDALHSHTRFALQSQITESFKRGYDDKNEVWRKEGWE